MKNLTLWLDDLLMTLRLRINEFVTCSKPTRLWLIGGVILSLILLLSLLGCSPQIITRCGADRALIQPIQLPVKPEKPTNGDLAQSHNNLMTSIILDNERKERLAKQLQECQ